MSNFTMAFHPLAWEGSLSAFPGFVRVTVNRDSGLGTESVAVRTMLSDVPGGSGFHAADAFDFIPTTYDVEFLPGQTEKFVDIYITPDAHAEWDEFLDVRLTTPGPPEFGYTVWDMQQIVIQNDDWAAISPVNASVLESGGSITFTVTRNSSQFPETLYFSTQLGSSSTNYTHLTLVPLDFGAGVSSLPVTVQLTDDSLSEASEYSITLLVHDSTQSFHAAPATSFNIIDDDYVINYSFQSPSFGTWSHAEGATFQYYIYRDSTERADTVYLSTAAGSASAADFPGLTDVQLQFAVGESFKLLTISSTDDTLHEGPETFDIVIHRTTDILSEASRQTVTLTDADPQTFTITRIGGNVSEAAGTVTFRIARNGDFGTASVYFSTAAGATANNGDYTEVASQLVSFAQGVSSIDVTVDVTNDSEYEASNETYNARIKDAGGAVLGTTTFTIVSDDLEPTGTTTTTGTIGDGETIRSELEVAGDIDWYGIELVEGSTYTIRLNGYDVPASTLLGALSDPILRLHDGIGTQVEFDDDSGPGTNAILSFTVGAGEGGTYFVSARAFNDVQPGGYELSVNPTGATDDHGSAATITPASPWITTGTPRTGNIEIAGDADWFPVALVAGTTYNIRLDGKDTQGGTLADPKVYVYSAGGQLITSDDDSGTGFNPMLGFTPTEGGTYFVGARAAGPNATGTYTVNVTTSTPGTSPFDPDDDFGSSPQGPAFGSIAMNSARDGSLSAAGDADWFAAVLTGGEAYTIHLVGLGADTAALASPAVYVHDVSGTLVAGVDDGSAGALLNFTPGAPGAGTYYISARAHGDSGTGAYQLVLMDTATATPTGPADDYGDTAATGATLASVRTGRVGANGDFDSFTLDTVAGTSYTLSLHGASTGSGTLANPAWLLAKDNVGMNDPPDAGVGLDEFVQFTADSSAYTVLVASFNLVGTGSYTLTLAETPGASAGDDFGGFTLAPGELIVNGAAVTGTLGVPGDADWFTVTFAQATEYTIRLDSFGLGSAALGDPFLYVYDEGGALVASRDDGAAGTNSLLRITPDAAGTYYIAARAYNDNGSGGYRLGVTSTDDAGTANPTDDYGSAAASTTPPPGTLTLAGGSATAAGTVGHAGDVDWFRFTPATSALYTVRLDGLDTASGTLADPKVHLYSATGALVDWDDDDGAGGNALLHFNGVAGTDYYIAARSASDTATGTYSISLTGDSGATTDDYGNAVGATAPPLGSLSLATSTTASATGSVGHAGDVDWFMFTATTTGQHTIGLHGTPTAAGTLADPKVYLHDAAGAQIDFDDDDGVGIDAMLHFNAIAGVDYYIAARSASASATGTYTLTLEGPEAVPAGPVDDYGNTIGSTGPSLGTIAPGGTATGTLGVAGDADWFAIGLTQGVAYAIGLNGSPTGSGTLNDPRVYLYDEDGNPLGSDDDSGTSVNALLRFTPAESGTFYISARSFNDLATGTYQVTVSGSSTGAPPGVDDYGSSAMPGAAPAVGHAAVGVPEAGTLELAGDADWFEISLKAGIPYTIRLDSHGAASAALGDPFVYVHDADGELLASRDDGTVGANSLLRFTPTADGIHYISARAFMDLGAGTYLLSVTAGESAGGGVDDFSATPATAGIVAVGGLANGKLEGPGDADWFKVTFDGGSEYTVGLNRAGTASAALRDPHVYVYDAAGTAVVADIDDGGTGVNSLLRFTAPGSGAQAYYIAARADGDLGTGSYQLNVVAGGEGTPGAGDDYAADILTTGAIQPGTPVTASLQTQGDADWFAVELTIGVDYAIRLDGMGTTPLPDPYVYLYDADGQLVASRDDGGPGVNSLLRFTPPGAAAGTETFYIAARSFNDLGVGGYRIEVLAESEPVAPAGLPWQGWGIA